MKFYSADEYQGLCEKQFRWYSDRIKALVPAAEIEHISASSIPMAVSKGDLDIYVGVNSAELEKVVRLLTKAGLQEKINTLRTPELCMLESTLANDVALQVVAKGSELECFLKFRDKLRANAFLVQQYNELKISCEGLSQESYREKKSVFVEYVLAQA
ncbi:GrpB family protein [Vibrio vulnificus]|uniref:GrpB family protein n=1 Tax=Vibrio vulnificus TaxID=672 RepID=UPI0012AD52CF|nr:GrpB family protein [Vibrio vulnificus]MCU8225455.1 GrpB family protein [Vibrio vulnificus]